MDTLRIILEAAGKTNDALNMERDFKSARAFALFCQYLDLEIHRAEKEEADREAYAMKALGDGQR